MIRLEVDDYCHSCLDFEADVVKPERVNKALGISLYTDTVVTCAYRKRCAAIKRYLEQQTKGVMTDE